MTIVGLLFGTASTLSYFALNKSDNALQAANDAKLQSAVIIEKINNISEKLDKLGKQQGITFATTTSKYNGHQ